MVYNTVFSCDKSNVRYVNMIKVESFKVPLFKVTSDLFIKVVSDWVST